MKKVVIVTGGGRGIGFGVAEAFILKEYRVVLTGRNIDTLLLAKTKLEKIVDGAEVLVVVADGTKEKDVINVIDETKKVFNRIDCLVNNAQSSKSGKLLVEHLKEDFDIAINSGLYATFFYMKYAFSMLKESKGSVINFASGAGISGKIGQSSYAASKEGIRGLSRVAASEWGAFGVRVNVICPLVETEGLIKFKKEYPSLYDAIIKDIPMGRFADAKNDVGNLCLFLASNDASFITGETITLQGGSGLRP